MLSLAKRQYKKQHHKKDLAYQLLITAFINSAHDLAKENRHKFKTDLQDPEKLNNIPVYVQFLDGIDKIILDEEMLLEYGMLRKPILIPLLKPFKSYFRKYLLLFGLDKNEAKNITERLSTYFVFEMNDEWRKNSTKYELLHLQMQTPSLDAAVIAKEWEAYYTYLEREVAKPVFGESFSLQDIYIPLRAYYEYEEKDEKEEKKVSNVVWLSDAMDNWLASAEPKDAIKVIAGGPGSGKSSFVKWWAAKLAKERQTKVLFFPLHHFNIHDNIKAAVGNYFNDVDNIPINFNPLEDTKGVEQLLLIFDGLDELVKQGKDTKQAASDFIDELKQFCGLKNQVRTKVKIVITGRPIAIQDAKPHLRGSDEQILELLPYFLTKEEMGKYNDEGGILKADQRKDWWSNFFVLKGIAKRKLPKELQNKTMDKITSEPLLNYLVALSWFSSPKKFGKAANINVVYQELIAGVYQRDYDTTIVREEKQHKAVAHLKKNQFIKILEAIAICAWQDGDTRVTTERKIESYIKERERGSATILESYKERTKSGVVKLLTAFYFRKFRKENTEEIDDTFEFTHKRFGEYLTARAIVELIKRTHEERKKNNTNSLEGWTIEEALLQWLKICGENVLDYDISQFIYSEIELRNTKGELIEKWQETLCELITEAMHKNMPIHKLVKQIK